MRALSLWQPWAWLLAHGHDHPTGKRVENRPWSTDFRGWFLIHASKSPGLTKTGRMTNALWKEMIAADQVILSARLSAKHAPPPAKDLNFGGIIGVAKLEACIDDIRDAFLEVETFVEPVWFAGPYGFVIGAARPLPFVPWRGRQGWFDVPVGELPIAYHDDDCPLVALLGGAPERMTPDRCTCEHLNADFAGRKNLSTDFADDADAVKQ